MSEMPDPEAPASVSRSASYWASVGLSVPNSEQSAQHALLGRVIPAPFVDDVGLVADITPDADLTDVLAVFGSTQMVIPPFEHPLATAGSTKQKDALFARNVNHHFVHRNGPPLAKRFDTQGHVVEG